MKRNKDNFTDKTPPGTPYEGNLQYGRLFGNKEPRSQFSDYPAERNNEGHSTNKCRIILSPPFERDPKIWGRKFKVVDKKFNNTEEFQSETLKIITDKLGRLNFNLTKLAIGKNVLKPKYEYWK